MSQENMELVRRLVEAFNVQDFAAARAVLTDEVEWRPAYTGGGAVEGTVYRGHAGFGRYLEELAETWGEIEGYIDDLRQVGERVLLIARIRFVGRGSGVEMVQPVTGVFTFRGGKIATAHYYVERREAFEAVGLRE
jgi:ketosteroid isomerase-like protein